MIEKLSRDISLLKSDEDFCRFKSLTSLDSEHFKQWLIHIKTLKWRLNAFFFTFRFSSKNMGSPPLFPEIDVLNQLFDSPSQIYICTFLVCISSERNIFIYLEYLQTDETILRPSTDRNILSLTLNSMCSAVHSEKWTNRKVSSMPYFTLKSKEM